MADRFSDIDPHLTSPAEHAIVITPNDATNIDATKAILVGVAGDLKVTMLGGAEVVLPVPAGYNPLRVTRIWSTSTTATGIVALY